MGLPAGLPRTILFDLTGLLKEGEHALRIRSNRTVYLDQALLGDIVETIEASSEKSLPSLRLTEAPLKSGDLRWLGYPKRYLPDGKPPAAFDYGQIEAESEWSRRDGLFTRFGDVTPLLLGVDDRFVVMGLGLEVALYFDA